MTHHNIRLVFISAHGLGIKNKCMTIWMLNAISLYGTEVNQVNQVPFFKISFIFEKLVVSAATVHSHLLIFFFFYAFFEYQKVN